jgi:hypothetical protein
LLASAARWKGVASLVKMWERWTFTVLGGDEHALADLAVGQSSGDVAHDLKFAWG